MRLGNSVGVQVAEGQRIRVLDSAGMVAAKLAAFHTIEAALAIADTRLQNQVRTGLTGILGAPFVLEVLDGSIPRGADGAQVMARLARLAKG